LRGSGLLWRARHVAAYVAADGELDLSHLFRRLDHRGRQLFLPVLRPHPRLKLWFVRHRAGEPMIRNRFGIPEPSLSHRHIRLPWALDLILLPLVGFDAECHRLGMGGGFYDRTLAYLRHRRVWHRPLLVGVAHECQRLRDIWQRPWDVPLNAVITEQGIYRPGRDRGSIRIIRSCRRKVDRRD
jgi:5-formyltetrahydrofolate cyclo-ligase